MQAKCAIPLYLEAVDEERELREEVYLELPHNVCGIPINQITPRLLSRLNMIRSPFIVGGIMSDGAIAQFLWALHDDFQYGIKPAQVFTKRTSKSLYGKFDEAEHEIDSFLEATFLDAPHGGPEKTPYVSTIAWTIYSMSREPFYWDKERTLDTPLREIYQYMRCRALDKGASLVNKLSDKKMDDWLKWFNGLPVEERLIIQSQINKRN